MNTPKSIVFHHSLTKDGEVKDFTAIRNYHMYTLGWRDIGYHYIMEKVNGVATVIKGRPENMSGAHTKQDNMNNESIGICIVGDYDKTELPHDLFDEAVKLITDIRNRYGDLPLRKHSEFANKTCPGLNFPFERLVRETSGNDYTGRWSERYIVDAIRNEIMIGYPDGSFKPEQTVTREELAVVVSRLLTKLGG